ncbi:MAG: Hsp20/alpha crystallin family protein [Solirubrobacterales bacterium]|nr:Hsp20/alpha crystallin family protein [Solirubrobacterales bacterium]
MSNRQKSAIHVVAIRQPFALFEPRLWRPPLNIYETRDALLLVAELAGMNLDQLQVYAQPAIVQIQGTRRLEAPAGLVQIHRMEITSGPFRIEVPTTTPVDPERVEAHYRNGLLEVMLPFTQQSVRRVIIAQADGGSL